MRQRARRDRALDWALPALVWICDGAGAMVAFNDAWCAYTGRSAADLEVADWTELIHPSDRPGALAAFLVARGEGEAFTLEYRLRSAAGEMRWHVLNVAPHELEDGSPGWIGLSVDIDERRRESERWRFLARASDALFESPDVAHALEVVARLAVPALGEWCAVYVLGRGDVMVPLAVVHDDPERARAAMPEFARAARDSGSSVACALAADAPLLLARDDDPLHAALGARAAMVVPLTGRDRRYGAIHFLTERDGYEYGEAELETAHELAARASAAYDEATLFASQQRAAADLRFLAEVGESMGESLDLQSRLVKFVQGVVPRLADWATVNLLTDDGSLETVAIAHRDPGKRTIAERLRGPYYGNTESYTGTPVAIREQRSILLRGVDESVLRVHIRPDTYDDVLALGADSAFIVPLVAHGRSYGTLSAMRSEREHPFAQGDMWLVEELARRAALAIANARLIERDRSVADAFQRASLPASLPHADGLRFDAYYAPGSREATIGGDWYDAFVLRDGRIVVSLGDVAGSGLSAAVVMNGVRKLLRGIAQLEPDPGVMLDATDRALRDESEDCVVTAVVGVIDPRERRMTFANAGHPAPLIRRANGTVEELAAEGLPLGLRESGESRLVTTAMEPGDLIVLYTDGLTESTRDILEGERRLREALVELDAPSHPAAAIVDAVLYDGSFDDVALLTIAIDEPATRRFASSDAAAAHRALEALLAALHAAGASAQALDSAALVFLELVGNAVRHAPGSIETRLFWRDGYAELEVTDEGPGFTPQARVGPPADPLSESGRGLFLVASLTRGLHFERHARGMRARAVLDVSEPSD